MEEECPNCLSEFDTTGKEAEGSFLTCPSCSLELQRLNGALVDSTEAALQKGYF